MQVPFVIDHVVRQTMVLIAQLATTGGNRAPLAQVADQVFRDLTRALEEHGVRRKVVADMFGMALRSYQQKVQRLSETTPGSGESLWGAVYAYLGETSVTSRAALLEHFRRADTANVVGVVEDMVESGLVFRSGRGEGAVYRVADGDDLARAARTGDRATLEAIVWSFVYREGPVDLATLQQRLDVGERELFEALSRLEEDGRIARGEGAGPDAARYTSAHVLLPLGDPAGWEASLLDHYQSVVSAICAKLQNGETRAMPDDQVGGSTLSFDVWPGHPHEVQVRSLLAEHRRQLSALWEAVSEFNRAGKPASHTRVSFYFGQSVTPRCPDGTPDE